MATIRKRGDRWQVQVRRKGAQNLSRSFLTKADAQTWARQVEAEADRRGLPADPRVLDRLTVADVIRRYRDAVVPAKRGREIETIILNAFLRQTLASVRLSELDPSQFGAYRDERLKRVKPATINRELGILQHAFEIARRDWGIPLPQNPVAAVRKPVLKNRRNRRLEGDELDRLLAAMESRRVAYLRPLVLLAVETSMRRSELVSLRWRNVDLERKIAFLPLTKNGDARSVPLSIRAVEVLSAVPRTGDRVFPVSTNAVRLAWERLRAAAGVEGLRFHDLRHEAVSRFFEKGLSVPEAALASGHRDLRMLARYTHLRPEAVAAKLD